MTWHSRLGQGPCPVGISNTTRAVVASLLIIGVIVGAVLIGG